MRSLIEETMRKFMVSFGVPDELVANHCGHTKGTCKESYGSPQCTHASERLVSHVNSRSAALPQPTPCRSKRKSAPTLRDNKRAKRVVFSPQGAWVCDETPLKPVGSIELKRENRTFWMDLPRADTGGVQRMMVLRREQPVEQVE